MNPFNESDAQQADQQPLPNVPARSTEADDSATPIQLILKPGQDPLSAQTEFVDNLVSKEFTQWEAWRRPWEYLWNECYRLYLNITELMKTPTRARVFIPAVFQVIEAAVPKVMTLVFGNDDFFDVIPDDPAQLPLADIIKTLLRYQLMKADFFIKFQDFVKQLLMYGTSYFYVYWKVVRKWVWKREAIRGPKSFLGIVVNKNAILGWKETKTFEVVERRPEIEVLDVLDVFPDPEARTEKDSRAIWVRSWMSIDEVKELGAGQYPVFDPMNVMKIEGGSKNTLQESRQVRNQIRGLQNGYVDKNQVELLTRWGLYDLDGDGIREETLIVIANRKYLLRAMPNPFHHQRRPIIRSALFNVPLEWFGVGLIEPIIPLQHELNTLRRQRLDNVNLILNRMWKVHSYADIDLETLVSSPNGIILTDDMNAIEEVETDNVTQSAYTESAVVQTDIENTTTPKSLQGTPESGRLGRTASGAQLIISQALEKFGTATKMVEETALKRVLRIMHELNLQFLEEDDATQPYETLFTNLKFSPDMINADIVFSMKGISEMIGKEGQINQIVSFMGVFGQVLAPQSASSLMKKMWKLMGFDPNEVDLVALPPMPGQGAPTPAPGGNPIANQVAHNGGATAMPGVPSAPKGPMNG